MLRAATTIEKTAAIIAIVVDQQHASRLGVKASCRQALAVAHTPIAPPPEQRALLQSALVTLAMAGILIAMGMG